MLYVNDLSDTVRTFLAERSGTPTPELVEVCRQEAGVRLSAAVTALLAEKVNTVSIDQAQDHLTTAKAFLSVADRLEAGDGTF
jgi:hypothetical protein